MTATTGIDLAIAQDALRHSESRYRRLFEAAQDGILLLNAVNGQIEDVNPYLINMLGYSHEEFLGKKLWEVGAFADTAQSKQMFADLQARGYVRLDDLPLKTRSGKSIDVEFVSNSYSCEGVKVIQCNIRDISDRTAAEAEARLRTRLYTALSACNKAIVHCSSEAELFPRVCRTVVQLGGMRMAWIGLVDPDSGLVRPVASFGDDTGYLQDIRVSASAESPYGRGPTGCAVRTNRPVWTDGAAAAGTDPWSALRALSGFKACGSLPLQNNGVVIGALSVYSGEALTFNLTTRDLLTEIAMDVSFAVSSFAAEALRARAEAAIIESEAQLAFTERVSRTGGWSLDLRDHSSRRTLEHDRIFGYSAPPLRWTHETLLEHVIPQDRAEATRKFREFLANGSALNLECQIRRVDGERRWIRLVSSDRHGGAGASTTVSGMVQDITERKQIEQALHENQQRLAGVLHSAMDAIVTADTNGALVLGNPAAAVMFGYASEELQGMPMAMLMPERFRVAHAAHVEEFGRSGASSRNLGNPRPIRGLRRNGEEFPLEASVSIDTSTGRPLYTAILRDITERERAVTAIEESRHRLELATDSACMGIWDWNLSTQELLWDPRMYALYGLQGPGAGDALAAWHAGVHPEDRAQNDAAVAAALAGRKDFSNEFRVVWPNGEVRHLEGHAIVKRDAGGAATRMTGVNWDITQRKRAEIRVSYLNRVFSVLSRINTLIVHVRDRGQLFQETCNTAVTTGGFRMAQIGMAAAAGGTVQVLASASDNAAPLATAAHNISSPDAVDVSMMERAIHTGKAVVANDSEHDPLVPQCAALAARGIRSFAVLPLMSADRAVGAIALYATERDFFHPEEMELLTELADDVAFAIGHIQQQERLEYLAYFDDLTELANRAQFLEQAARRMAAAAADRSGLVLLLIDLERFRNVNDSLDRAAGDQILQQVAQWLTMTVDSSCLVARVGPDHFAVLQPGAPDEALVAQRVATLLDTFLQHPFRAREADFRMAAKVGVALYPDHGSDPDTLLRHAEVALKRAKAVGVRFLVYTLEMTKAVAGRLRLETQLRQAVENEEFVLHYQPKVNIATGAMTGAEALLRWNDPHTGLVPPGQFIGMLEETGLIHEVGRWALRTAVGDYLRWRAAGLPAVRLSVNVSPLQLRDQGFIAEIGRIIGVHADAPGGLELEVTESVVMDDVARNSAVLEAVRAMGVTIAIDDFGTGFSSLSYLARLPVNTLKIDRSFVTALASGEDAVTLVATIIRLAQGLDLNVVAEGVETEEEHRLLRLLGCDEMQGYLFSKPVSRQDFEKTFLMAQAGLTQ